MDDNKKSSNNSLQEILFELEEPVIFKNILCTTEGSNSWKLLDWSLEDIAKISGDRKLPFRVGKNSRTIHPQWEVETPIENKTMKEFLNDVQQNNNPKWFYFDYKRMNEWFTNEPELLNSFNWQIFGLDFDASDSTIWIGSKGAHTNCHRDTYGCNLIAQTHGRKLWLLFSPECSDYMQPTRIPYEESTVYSKYNFFTPNEQEIEAIKKMPSNIKMVILEPKDILFVPKGWWHYVESLETSLSVNIWLPLKEDCNARLKETLVHLIVNKIGDGIPKATDQPDSNLLECIQFVETSLKECKNLKENTEPLQKRRKLNFSDSVSLQTLKVKYPHHIKLLPNLNCENLCDFMKKNDIVGDNDISIGQKINESNEPSTLNIFEAVVDAFCHPTVISKVSEILKNKFIQCHENID